MNFFGNLRGLNILLKSSVFRKKHNTGERKMGSNYFSTQYNVDIVMCIDATGSMTPLLNMVKANALSFYNDLTNRLEMKDKKVSELRVKVIAFRDYLADGKDAMLATEFLTLPAQSSEFESAVKNINAFGGGDNPEDSLEALGYAIKSKWNKSEDNKKRHVIVLWTDDDAHPLGFGKSAPNYPAKMARNFNELSEWWGLGQSPNSVMDRQSKRLLIYAPAMDTWTNIASLWDNVLLFPSDAGKGLDDRTYSEILDAIVSSV